MLKRLLLQYASLYLHMHDKQKLFDRSVIKAETTIHLFLCQLLQI